MTCERVVIINEGHIVATDSVENLTARLKGATEINLEIEGNPERVKEMLKDVEGVEEVEIIPPVKERINRYIVRSIRERDIRKEISEKIVNSGFGLLEISLKEMSLEDIFLKLVTEE